ncbi:hypothetical protein K9U39_12425 [Rhodoblastus acidophilus]|uniref:Uncharacterized protein n=1 Tax=Candidatus Rhodoblastus alkanivorans TaxID=2954117 RepID=A0ABS9Z9P6_9HYPH|nr:hypothetical protein [Candidatus Rhodoblastus alkanivorans]MCI4677061.1 hypothetical protein [Candidatus Rhodoblastus alkanivorans]MCI4684414.1 hypothetical protein [Candidatus Rhodoblastus alkanivorans]MDI4641735.1 hypothetical protein [Rhodoblastus acidophilus]
MHAEIYTDGVDEITVGGSIVRVDLVSLSPTERDANNAPKRVLCQRLIFSVEAFANSVEVMQKALQGLVEAGAIRRGAPTLAATSDIAPGENHQVTTNNSSRAPNVSANFR